MHTKGRKFTEEDVKEIEGLWRERHNALITTMIDFCKKMQHTESNIAKSIETPIIFMLDDIILELTKHKI